MFAHSLNTRSEKMNEAGGEIYSSTFLLTKYQISVLRNLPTIN